ncbi:xaa-Pro aminopeptidase 3-like isoform X2 [Dreissena polymorpha]|nr:xaa-Pro aminopeptidase 3-like isoform X2 [Dreissena polymorpha]
MRTCYQQQQNRHFGQPVHETHPHLMGMDEVTPGITRAEYQQRRLRLATMVQEAKTQQSIKHSIVLIPSATKVIMTNDIPYTFRQNTDFLYMSGFQEPDSMLVILISDCDFQAVLFVPKHDADRELWDGPRSGDIKALHLTGVSESYNSDELEKFLYNYCKNHKEYAVWYNTNKPIKSQHNAHSIVDEFLKQNNKTKFVQNPLPLIEQMRLIKSTAEIKLMTQTTQMASKAFIEVMRASKPNVNESFLYAKMDYECRIRGAEFLAYPPVVAGGDRANVIHYTRNNCLINDGELVLMDAGCEYHGYTSDITRTWPVSGKFTKAQRLLYECVLEVQEALLGLCTPQYSLADLYKHMFDLLTPRLLLMNVIPSEVSKDEHMLTKLLRELCPHDVGHYLGMDVHDTASISKRIKLQPGMVVTIEPGLYVKSSNTVVPAQFRGIGIRIEDNVLITDGGPVVLTRDCPKHPDHIETLMASS